MGPTTTSASTGLVRRPVNRWAVVAVLCVSLLIVNVDTTILNVALPTIVDKLHATSSQLQWIVDAYALALAGLVLVGGSLADRFGRKRFFVFGLAVFCAGSIGAAFSGSVHLLIACRAVMGAGAAAMMPSSLSIINEVFRDPAERARAIGAWAGTSGIGIAIGPIVGGLLLSHFWWGSVFLVNVPFVILGLVGATVLVPDSRNPVVQRPDPGGATLSIVGLALVLWSIIEAPVSGWGAASVLATGAAGLAVLGVFLLWERASSHPMLQLRFFADRRFSAAATGELLGLFGLLGALFVQTQFLQFDLGFSPLAAGVRILPIAAVLGVTAVLSPFVVRIVGARVAATTGLLAIAAGLWQTAAVASVTTSYGDVVPGMMLIGFGAGLLIPTMTNSLVGSVPRGDAGVGSATNGVALQVGGALGVAVVGSLLATRFQDHLRAALAGRGVPSEVLHAMLGSLGGALGVAHLVGGDSGRALAAASRSAFMSGVALSLDVAALVALCAAAVTFVRLPGGSTRAARAAPTDRVTSTDRALAAGVAADATVEAKPARAARTAARGATAREPSG